MVDLENKNAKGLKDARKKTLEEEKTEGQLLS